jgi:DHA2 family multidrug resistance protein
MGIAFLSTFIDHRIATHSAHLVEQINIYNHALWIRLSALQAGLVANGTPAAMAKQQAFAIINGIVDGQSGILSYEDAFLVIGIVFACSLPLLIMLRRIRPDQVTRGSDERVAGESGE